MNKKLLLFLFSMLAAASSQAQMYKWVDANGRVTYSDMPPPSSVKQKRVKAASMEEDGEVALPYSLSVASRDHPVALYTSSHCEPCEQGRVFLKKRGVPFSEKTVSTQEDIDLLKQVGGDGRMPYFTVGRNGFTGFDAASWGNALTVAGYPESNQMPSNYRQKPAQPAAPSPVAASRSDSGTSSGARN